MRVKASHRTRLQQELARAVERGEIDVAFQPVIDLCTRRPSMLEALARWRRPGQPPVPADVFIALAEESGAINKIGLEVLRRACRAAERWRHLPGFHDLGIAVNVSVHQILAGHLADQRRRGPARHRPPADPADAGDHRERRPRGLRPAWLAEFDALQAMGVCIAVDDFGAGYSSLGLPAPLPGRHPEDRQGLHRAGHRRDTGVGVRRRHPGARSPAGLAVVAEGVEDQGQLARLRGMGCELGQGFYFARPAPLDELIPRTDRSLAGGQVASRAGSLRNAGISTD